jgi:hypothetical protein
MGENHVPPTLGRIVFFGCREITAADGTKSVEERPAIVVRVWTPGDPKGAVQLQVFLDGVNDRDFFDAMDPRRDDPGNLIWRTSVLPADDQRVAQVGRWRWPPHRS